MKTFRVGWTIGIFFMFLSGCINNVSHVDLNPVGKKYVGSITLRGMELPLPEGEWEVVGSGYCCDQKFAQIILEKDVKNMPESVIFISRDAISNSYAGYLPDEELKRKDFLHVVSNNNIAGEAQDGWYINHMRYKSLGEKSSEANSLAFQHIIDNKLVLPGNFIAVKHRFTGPYKSQKLLTYALYINPEAQGFSPPANAEWASSDWNILKINSDPKKVAFIETLKQEQSVFHKTLHTAFLAK